MSKFYAVKEGRTPGVYSSWEEAQQEIGGFSGAVFKSFGSEEEALNYISVDSLNKNTNNEYGESEIISIYVDGSFSSDKKRYGSGWVSVINDEAYVKKSFSGEDSRYIESRNVAGELLATIDAIQWAIEENYKSVTIFYDYTGIEKWAKNEWKANKDVSKDYVKNYLPLASKININFEKIKSHSNNSFNDMADKLAKTSLLEKGSRENSDGSLTIYGIDKDELEIVFELIESDIEGVKIVTKQNSKVKLINYTLIVNKDRVVLNYYDTGVSTIQGKNSNLMESLLIYVLQLVENPSEVIETLNVFNKVDVDMKLVTEAFDKYLPNYDASKLSSNKLDLVLTSAAYNLTLEIEKPEYSDLAMPVLRALEAYLHVMLKKAGLNTTKQNASGKVSNNFCYFDLKNGVYSLQEAHTKFFDNNPEQLQTLNSMYNFYNNNRHTLFHWDEENEDTRILDSIEQVREIIKAGFEYIDNFYVFY